jgi:hypothetical protein
MVNLITQRLIPDLKKKDASWLLNAKFKITMLPSVGFFIVAPRTSIILPGSKAMTPDQFEATVHAMAEDIGWKFCFQQGIGGECLLYF